MPDHPFTCRVQPPLTRAPSAGPCRWNARELPYWIGGAVPSSLTVGQRDAGCEKAWQHWQDTPARIPRPYRVGDIGAAKVRIWWENARGPGGAIATAGLPCGYPPGQDPPWLQVTMYVLGWTWTPGGVVGVAGHELGHILGSDHGPATCLMAPTWVGIQVPQPWDVATMRAIYPGEQPMTPIPDTEFRRRANDFYRAAFNRDGDGQGLDHWCAKYPHTEIGIHLLGLALLASEESLKRLR